MAIKKCFVVFVVLLFLFSFSYPVSADGFFIPDSIQTDELEKNIMLISDFFQFPAPSTTETINMTGSFIYLDDVQYYLIVGTSSSMYCIPVSIVYLEDSEISGYSIGCSFNQYGTVVPTFFAGLLYFDSYDAFVFCCSDAIRDQVGQVVLSYLPKDKPADSFDSTSEVIFIAVNLIGALIYSFTSPTSALFPLMKMLMLGISVAFVIFVVKIIRRFIWGV